MATLQSLGFDATVSGAVNGQLECTHEGMFGPFNIAANEGVSSVSLSNADCTFNGVTLDGGFDSVDFRATNNASDQLLSQFSGALEIEGVEFTNLNIAQFAGNPLSSVPTDLQSVIGTGFDTNLGLLFNFDTSQLASGTGQLTGLNDVQVATVDLPSAGELMGGALLIGIAGSVAIKKLKEPVSNFISNNFSPSPV